MKNSISIFLLMIMMGVLIIVAISCDSPKEDQTKLEHSIEAEKQEIQKDLETLRDNIDSQIKKIDNQLEEASDEAREKLQEARKELEDDRKDVNKALNEVKDATGETWKDIKAGTQKTFAKVKEKVRSATESIAELFEKDKRRVR
ncbi:MAG: hypothetical protein E6Q96_10130 [Cyclobacteriaceae bacterium]|nr:MAG: hypothetical protein E6Q96_10130 [Cyclobacteriaceae bacterium]